MTAAYCSIVRITLYYRKEMPKFIRRSHTFVKFSHAMQISIPYPKFLDLPFEFLKSMQETALHKQPIARKLVIQDLLIRIADGDGDDDAEAEGVKPAAAAALALSTTCSPPIANGGLRTAREGTGGSLGN